MSRPGSCRALANLQAELFQVRVTLNQLRVELARHRDTNDRTAADTDVEIVAHAAGAMTGLDAVISRIRRRLGQH